MLEELRRHLRNLRRRKFITDVAWNRRLATEHSISRIESCAREIDEHIRKLARFEKDYKDEQEAIKQLPIDKTAGRNELRPRLGR